MSVKDSKPSGRLICNLGWTFVWDSKTKRDPKFFQYFNL